MFQAQHVRRTTSGGTAKVSLTSLICGLTLCSTLLAPMTASAGTVVGTYTDLPLNTGVNLTTEGLLDWVKWGVIPAGGPSFATVGKLGVTPQINRTLTGFGPAPAGTAVVMSGFPAIPPGNIMNFTWSDGTPTLSGFSDSVVTETILPAQFDYPIGIGTGTTVTASASARILDLYVQGFNADMLIIASMSGGAAASTQVSPSKRPAGDPNNYSSGRYRVIFSGAGETLTVTVRTANPVLPGSVRFANAGFFAATLRSADQPLGLSVNTTAFRTGQTLVLNAMLTPGAYSALVDAYVLLRVPGGGFLSLQLNGSLLPGIVPIATGFAPFALSSTELLRVAIPGGVDSGLYTWIGQLTQAGSGNLVGATSEVNFTLTP